MDSETVQSYVRRALYWLSGAMVSHGMISADAFWLEPVIALLITLATFGWSLYGDRLNGLLGRVQAKDGVQKTTVVVDPNKINPTSVNVATPNGVTAQTS
jgi:divalent metal cation (Fe/Co/Zn/Cd) transporter